VTLPNLLDPPDNAYLPLYFELGPSKMLKLSPEMRDDSIDLEYVADNLWLVGSPTTVAKRIQLLRKKLEGSVAC
jgi:hypothetical protein